MSHYTRCLNCGEEECMDSDTGVHRLDDGTICPDPRDKLIADLRAEIYALRGYYCPEYVNELKAEITTLRARLEKDQ